MVLIGAIMAVSVFVWLFIYGDRTFDRLAKLIEKPEPVKQPNEDDPGFMAHVERKVRHLED